MSGAGDRSSAPGPATPPLRRPARRRCRGARVADRPRDRSRPRPAVAGRARPHVRGPRRAGAGARRPRTTSRACARRRASTPPSEAAGRRRPARSTRPRSRRGAAVLAHCDGADRRGRPGLRGRQAAARVLRAPRLRRRARARGAVCAHARAAGLLVLADGKRGDVPVTAAAYGQALDRRDAVAVRRRARPAAPTRSPPTRCSAATRSRRWSTTPAPPAPACSCSSAPPTRAPPT